VSGYPSPDFLEVLDIVHLRVVDAVRQVIGPDAAQTLEGSFAEVREQFVLAAAPHVAVVLCARCGQRLCSCPDADWLGALKLAGSHDAEPAA
jgi:hypothetical protein